MPNPNALYEDMQKLNDLFNELCWDPDDELVFTHDGEKILVINKTQTEKWVYQIGLNKPQTYYMIDTSIRFTLKQVKLISLMTTKRSGQSGFNQRNFYHM